MGLGNMFSPFKRDPVVLDFNVTAGTVIDTGTPVWWDGTTLRQVGGSAANLVATWVDEETSRRLAASHFAGIFSGETTSKDDFDREYAVMANAIWEAPCTSFTPKIGDMVGFEKDSGGNYLYKKTLQRVLHPYDAIGYVTKDYSAASTLVQAQLLSAFDGGIASLRALVFRIGPIGCGTRYTAGGDILTNWDPKTQVRLLAIESVVTTLTAGVSTISVLNGATTLTDTLTVADASAVGVVDRTEFTDATNDAAGNFIYDIGGALDITCDATPTAGDVDVWLEFMLVPKIA